jgi:hypothetical protein
LANATLRPTTLVDRTLLMCRAMKTTMTGDRTAHRFYLLAAMLALSTSGCVVGGDDLSEPQVVTTPDGSQTITAHTTVSDEMCRIMNEGMLANIDQYPVDQQEQIRELRSDSPCGGHIEIRAGREVISTTDPNGSPLIAAGAKYKSVQQVYTLRNALGWSIAEAHIDAVMAYNGSKAWKIDQKCYFRTGWPNWGTIRWCHMVDDGTWLAAPVADFAFGNFAGTDYNAMWFAFYGNGTVGLVHTLH